MPKPHVIHIKELGRPTDDGLIKYHVRLPGWRGPIGTGSMEDAHKVAAAFQPDDGRSVVTRVHLHVRKQSKRALGLRLTR